MIEQTRPLPKNLETLRRRRGDWIIERTVERGYREEDIGLGETRLTSFVRHQYTNYEAALEGLPSIEGRTIDEMMSSYFAREEVYLPMKAEATALAIRILNMAYGSTWEICE